MGGNVDVVSLMNASDQGLLDNIPLDKIGAVKSAWEQQKGAMNFIDFMTNYEGASDVATGLRELAVEAQVAMKPKYRSPQSWHNNFHRVLKQDNGLLKFYFNPISMQQRAGTASFLTRNDPN